MILGYFFHFTLNLILTLFNSREGVVQQNDHLHPDLKRMPKTVEVRCISSSLSIMESPQVNTWRLGAATKVYIPSTFFCNDALGSIQHLSLCHNQIAFLILLHRNKKGSFSGLVYWDVANVNGEVAGKHIEGGSDHEHPEAPKHRQIDIVFGVSVILLSGFRTAPWWRVVPSNCSIDILFRKPCKTRNHASRGGYTISS